MRNRYVLLADLPLIAIAAFGAFVARFDLLFYQHRPEFRIYLLAALAIKPTVFFLFGMYGRYWRYAGLQELPGAFFGGTASSIAMTAFVATSTTIPGSI